MSQSCDSYAVAFCCRDVGPNRPNNKHSLEEHLWHVGSMTSAVASLRVERLGWLQSKQNYHCMMAGVELDRCASGHEMSPQQSVVASSSTTQTWIALGKTGCYLQLRSFTFFALHDLYSGPFYTLLAGGCPKVVILTQLPFAVEMWAQMGQITNTAWKNTCGTLAVRLQQWHPCEWQD